MDDGKPVLTLVDGLRLGHSNLALVAHYYESLGFIVERLPFQLDDIRDIESCSAHLSLFVSSVAKRYPGRKLSILSYSKGGIAMVDAIKNHGIAPLLHCAVSYGTPYRGSLLATLVSPVIPQRWLLPSQLRFLSPYLRRLQALPMPEGLPIVSVAGAFDLLCPPPLCRLKGAENITVNGSHTSFLYRTGLHDRLATRFR